MSPDIDVPVLPVSDRCAYAGVVEHFVSVHPRARGRLGLVLLTALLAPTEAAGVAEAPRRRSPSASTRWIGPHVRRSSGRRPAASV